MKLIKREKRITIPQFCSIFTNREFGTRDKLFKSIYFVEDSDGNYRIEERINFIGCVSLIILTGILVIPFFISSGIIGVYKTIYDNKGAFTGEPLRVDECKHNIKSTAQLLEFTGWY